MNYLRLPLDKNKRHFVIGDIHGRFDELQKLLELANYDEENDILYSVGDLIDRGYKSVEVTEFFVYHDNRYAVMGNHEVMALVPDWYNVWMNNGGFQTITNIQDHGWDSGAWCKETLSELPFVIDVGEDDDPDCFRILHAEIPYDWDETKFQEILKNGTFEDFDKLIWGRKTITAINHLDHIVESPMEARMEIANFIKAHNARKTMVGHTPVGKITQVGNQIYLDTGAGSHFGSLSMMEMLSGEKFTYKFPKQRA